VALVVNPTAVEPNIDRESLYDKLGFKPHSTTQHEIAYSDYRFNTYCCGRRFGKSLTAGVRGIHKYFVPDTYNWIVGPTYKLGEKEFRVVYRAFEALGLLKHCKKSYDVKGGNMRIETPWKTIIEVVSAEKPDSLLGEGLYHVIMSEAARHARATWEQYIEPALSDLRGTADFPSTPKGFNWYHGLFQLGDKTTTDNKDYHSWRAPTWDNIVRYPGGRLDPEIIRIESTVSKTYFDQEYGAQFTSYAGAIYEEWDETKHVGDFGYNDAWPNYLVMDYGFSNPFVALDVQVDASESVWVWREYYSRWQTTYTHGENLKFREQPEHYHIEGLWGDPRGANEAATLAPLIGFVASDASVTWKQGVDAIKTLLKAEKLHISRNCPNLIRQMSQLHVKEQRRAENELDEKGGENNIQHKVDDHAADALRYFIGPYYVNGAGDHFSDTYGQPYDGSESDDFFTLHNGMVLDNSVTSNRLWGV
jgi:hypothetical protein